MKLSFFDYVIILFLFLFAITGCSSTSIPDVAVYKDLPFSGKCLEVWTVSETVRLTEVDECNSLKEKSLLIPPESWATIKKSWISACLKAGTKCEQDVSQIDDFITGVDNIVKEAYGKTNGK